MKKIKIFALLMFLVFSVNHLIGQDLSGSKIIQNMKDKSTLIQDYTADLEASMNMENIRIPRIKIKMYHKYPDKFHYESKNFALLPKQGLNFNPFNYDEKDYTFTFLRTESIDNTTTYVVEVESKKKEKTKSPKTNIWVDANNWVPKKISVDPNERRKLQMLFEHAWVEDKYFLPSKIFFEYDIPESPEVEGLPKDASQKASKITRGGKASKGSVSVAFKNYKVNIGLSDEIFRETESKKK